MTMRSKQICTYPGCGRLTDKPGRCDKHRIARDTARANANARGYNYQWRKARALFIQANPICVSCHSQGLIVSAMVVDHIKPHKGDTTLFWNSANWQSLCKRCHDRKTARENGGFGNAES